MSKIALSVILTLLLVCTLGGVSVQSIKAVDSAHNENELSISLSGATAYQVDSAPDGKIHRITISNTEENPVRPDYKRLSPVIDKITYHQVGGNTIIEIRTMAFSQISHRITGNQISMSIVQESAEPVPKPLPTWEKTVKTGPDIPEPEAPKAPLQKSQPDTLSIQGAAADSVAEEETEPAPQPVKKPGKLFFDNWLLIMLLALGLVLVIVAVWIRSMTPKTPKLDEIEEPPAMIMDSATKERMVLKLFEKNWTTAQIAAELRLPIDDVQRIITEAKK